MANYVAPVSGTWAAKGSSPFKAARSGGHRYHAGNDLQAKNGSPAVAAIGGTVQYVGHNQGYQWNAVVMGDDGNAYRYATHGPISVKEGQRIEAGQKVGEIARGHLHFEVIPPTSPAYKQMAAKPGQFVSTSWKPGHGALTADPAAFFGVKGGTRIAVGQPVGSAAPQTAQSAIADLVAPTGGTQVPEPLTAAMGFAPTLPEMASFTPPASVAPPMPRPPVEAPPQWASAAGFPIDEALTGQSADEVLMGGPRPSPNRPPMPASGPVGPTTATGVLDVGPRLRPPDMFVINPISGAPDAGTVPAPPPNPRNMIASAPVGPTTPQGVLDMGPNLRPADRWMAGAGGAPDASRVPNPPMRPDPFASTFPPRPEGPAGGMPAAPTADPSRVAAIQGIIDQGISDPNEIWGYLNLDRDGNLVGDIATNEIQAVLDRGEYRAPDATAAIADEFGPGLPTFGGPQPVSIAPNFEVRPASFQTPFAGRPEVPATGLGPQFDMSAAIGGPPAVPPPDLTPASAPIMADPLFDIDRELADSMDRMRSERETLNLANDIGFTRRQMEPFQPAYRPPPPSPVEERLDDATAPAPLITQNIPPSADGPTGNVVLPWNDRGDGRQSFIDSIPAPPPIATGTGEFGRVGNYPPEAFGAPPAPPTPPPLSMRALDDQFDIAFSPNGVMGQIYDVPGAFASIRPPPVTAQDGINSVFGPPPAQAEVPNLAIPFAEVAKPTMAQQLGIDSIGTAAAPPPVNWAAGMDTYVQNRFPASTFAGGSVIRPPTNPMPGQPGVVQGTMPTPEGAMDIRPPAQGGPALTPAAPLPGRAPPVAPPRQTNAGAVRNGGRGILGGIVGGALGGPIGALAGGLLGRSGIFGGGGGNGFGFGGQPSFAWSSGGNAPYGNNGGSTTYQKGTSNALGGSNALSWQGSKGQTITAIQDPFSGQYFTSYGPTVTGGGLY